MPSVVTITGKPTLDGYESFYRYLTFLGVAPREVRINLAGKLAKHKEINIGTHRTTDEVNEWWTTTGKELHESTGSWGWLSSWEPVDNS